MKEVNRELSHKLLDSFHSLEEELFMKNRIGIVGGGQLARMLALDGKKLGFYITVLDPTPHSPGGQVADRQIVAPLTDAKAMRQLADNSDFLTIEWEMADSNLLNTFAKEGITVHPSAKTLEIIKDKLAQKKFLKKNNIPVADFTPVTSKEDVKKVATKFGYPLILKARFDSYDGKGNALIEKESDIPNAMERLKGKPLYIEKYVPFVKEISVMVARSTSGAIVPYPTVENIHKNNILHITIAPARIAKKIDKKAQALAKKVMKHLLGAGVFGIEMFVDKNGKILINEIAPRVHNSGHHSIESSYTSQFQQHIRAITGLPLGNTALVHKASVMINILGRDSGPAQLTGLEKVLQLPNTYVHIYGKKDTNVERKMGHITVVGKSVHEVLKKAIRARKLIEI